MRNNSIRRIVSLPLRGEEPRYRDGIAAVFCDGRPAGPPSGSVPDIPVFGFQNEKKAR